MGSELIFGLLWLLGLSRFRLLVVRTIELGPFGESGLTLTKAHPGRMIVLEFQHRRRCGLIRRCRGGLFANELVNPDEEGVLPFLLGHGRGFAGFEGSPHLDSHLEIFGERHPELGLHVDVAAEALSEGGKVELSDARYRRRPVHLNGGVADDRRQKRRVAGLTGVEEAMHQVFGIGVEHVLQLGYEGVVDVGPNAFAISELQVHVMDVGGLKRLPGLLKSGGNARVFHPGLVFVSDKDFVFRLEFEKRRAQSREKLFRGITARVHPVGRDFRVAGGVRAIDDHVVALRKERQQVFMLARTERRKRLVDRLTHRMVFVLFMVI